MTAARRPLRFRGMTDEQRERRETLLAALQAYRPVTPAQAAASRAVLAAAAAPARCRRGHVRTRTNTYMDPRGWRQCRTCERTRRQTARRPA